MGLKKRFKSLLTAAMCAAFFCTGSLTVNADLNETQVMKASENITVSADSSGDIMVDTTPATTTPQTTMPQVQTLVTPITLATTTQAPIFGYKIVSIKCYAENITVGIGDKTATMKLRLYEGNYNNDIPLSKVCPEFPEGITIESVYDDSGKEIEFDKDNNSFNMSAMNNSVTLKLNIDSTVKTGTYQLKFDISDVYYEDHHTNYISYIYDYGNNEGLIEVKDPAVTSPAVTTDAKNTTVTTTTQITSYVTEVSYVTELSYISYTTISYTTPICVLPPCGSVSVVSKPEKIEYNLGDELDLSGLTVSLLYPVMRDYYHFDMKIALENVSPEDYPDYFKFDTSEFDSSKPGTYKITIDAVDKAYEFYNFYFVYGSFYVTVTDKITGDANGDNTINILDAAYIASKIAGRKINELPEWADYNGDKLINIVDAASIARDVAKGKLHNRQ